MKRFGMCVRLRPEKEQEYRELHGAVWPEVLAKIREVNIRNYSIFLRDGVLFAYLEYVGTDFAADMQKMADDPKTLEWWTLTNPCQEPYDDRPEGQWWSPLEEVFHTD